MSESGITLHAHLPLEWQATQSFPPLLLAEWMHSNLICLHALAALESHDKEIDTSATVEHTAGRLEAKVDLLLQLVGELMRKQQPSPPSVDVALGADEIAWDSTTPITAGSEGTITLFLSPRLHWPLTLPAHVISVQGSIQGSKVHAKPVHLSEEVQEWLERTLFRYHRRALQARAR